MERIYILDELDCANCAMKIERHVGKIKGVKECSVDFVSKRMFVDMEHEGIEAVLKETVQAIEPDVILRRKDDKKAASAGKAGGKRESWTFQGRGTLFCTGRLRLQKSASSRPCRLCLCTHGWT